jgi:F-type H+-transporting ATPase subunit epsilon
MAEKVLKVEIASPDRLIYSGEAESLVAPGAEGELGILPRHTHLMAALTPGEIRLRQGGKTLIYAISSGFMEVSPKKVLILADSAEQAGDISVERANKALERAKKRLKEVKSGDINPDRAKLALLRAINRLKVARRK